MGWYIINKFDFWLFAISRQRLYSSIDRHERVAIVVHISNHSLNYFGSSFSLINERRTINVFVINYYCYWNTKEMISIDEKWRLLVRIDVQKRARNVFSNHKNRRTQVPPKIEPIKKTNLMPVSDRSHVSKKLVGRLRRKHDIQLHSFSLQLIEHRRLKMMLHRLLVSSHRTARKKWLCDYLLMMSNDHLPFCFFLNGSSKRIDSGLSFYTSKI